MFESRTNTAFGVTQVAGTNIKTASFRYQLIGWCELIAREVVKARELNNRSDLIGEYLLEALEASTYCTPEAIGGFPQTSGIEWTLDTTREFDQGDIYTLNGKDTSYYAPASIQRVTITSVNGEPFDENAVYAVVTNNFCAAGGDTYNVFNRAYSEGFGFDTGITMDEAVMAYVTEVLDGVIGEQYAEPSTAPVQIRAE